MPHYLITITLKSGQQISGVRFTEEYNIDKAWQLFEAKAISTVQHLKSFDLVMLSKRSSLYKKWVAEEQKKRSPNADFNNLGHAYEKGKEEIRYSSNGRTNKTETGRNWGM